MKETPDTLALFEEVELIIEDYIFNYWLDGFLPNLGKFRHNSIESADNPISFEKDLHTIFTEKNEKSKMGGSLPRSHN
jgi:hypothetical protein